MDTLTHALSGALLARATAPAIPRPGELTYIDLHRGVTHSIILLPAWALLLAWLFSRFSRQRYSWRAIYGTAVLGIHIGGDLFTAYGTMMLAPFSHYRFAFPFSFIIDLYFTSIIVIGLAGVMLIRQRRYPAVIALMVLGGYVGFQGKIHRHNIARSHILS